MLLFGFVSLCGAALAIPFDIQGQHLLIFTSTSGLLLGMLLAAAPGEPVSLIMASLPAIFLTVILAPDHTLASAAALIIGTLLQALLGRWLLNHIFRGVPAFHSAADVFRFLAGSAVTAAAGATVALYATRFAPIGFPALQVWPLWWAGELLGLIIFAPLVLAWTADDSSEPRVDRANFAECLLFLVALCLAAAIEFGLFPAFSTSFQYPFLAFPILMWGTIRIPRRALTAATLLLALLAATGTLAGGGPFAKNGPFTTVFHLQVFLCVVQVCLLVAGSVVHQQRIAEAKAQTLADTLERRVLERSAELEESRSRYQELMDLVPVGIFRMDADGRMIYVNERWCDMAGIPAAKALVKGWLSAVHPMDRERVVEDWAEGPHSTHIEFRFAHTDNTVSCVEAHCVPQIQDNQLTGYIGCITDITARKEAELLLHRTHEELESRIGERTLELSQRNEELAREVSERDRIARVLLESESTLRAFFESAPMMMGIVELMRDDIFFVSVNASGAAAFMGCTTLPATGRTVREMGWTDEEITPWIKTFHDAEHRRQPMRLRQRRTVNGEEREFAATVSYLGRAAAGQARYCYVAEDITEAARAQATTERFRAILEATTDMVGMADKSGNLFYINSAGRDLLGLAPDEPVTGLRLPDVHPPWASNLVALEGIPVAMIEGVWSGEAAVVPRNGPEIPTSELILAHKSPTGSVEFISTIIRDIADQKAAEARVKASLEEKEVLLKEIHHRVKNNLQIVSSLLQLQSTYIKDPGALSIFEESRDRIKSMALIHEQLYQSSDLAQIDFPEYLRSLVNTVLAAHRSSRSQIETRLHVDPISLDLDTAIPVGLITNELLTNSLKYAFNGRPNGEVGVRLTRAEGEGDFLLTISDDGVGFPKDFNFDKAPTLGLRLVRILSKQMRARLEIANGTGTQFKLYFKTQAQPIT